ncbi:MAG: replicative DNA helicase [Nitrospina sp.]|jgi:replicative DNA helicase|nr:replicative DNA helicase [Nitrospina sp.]
MADALTEISLNKLPPYNKEAEQSVLGSCLHSSDAIAKALEVLSEEDFYKAANKKIFIVMREQFEANEPIDVLALADRLRKKDELDNVGGLEYLSLLEDYVPTATAVSHHAKILREKKILRDLIQTATDIVSNSYSDRDDVDTLLDKAEQSIFEISEKRTKPSFHKLPDVIRENVSNLEKLSMKPGMVTGVSCGFTDLDNMTAGFQPSDLIILAARPSMGKTSFALDIARFVSLHEKIPTAIFSLEMSKQQLGVRLLCSQARVDSSKVRTGYLAKSDWPKVHEAGRRLSEAQMYIDDSAALSVLDLRARARRLAAEQPLGLIIIDYLQLMSGRGGTESRQLEVSDISRGLKALAKELNVPIIALSQLSRAVESRTDKRPLLSDLRESGSIEQDADVVMFIYRDVVYNPETDDPGKTEILVRKQRNGPIGDVKLHFENQFTRFFDRAEREDAPPEAAPNDFGGF